MVGSELLAFGSCGCGCGCSELDDIVANAIVAVDVVVVVVVVGCGCWSTDGGRKSFLAFELQTRTEHAASYKMCV